MGVPAIIKSERESVIFLLVTCSPFVLVEKRCLEVVCSVTVVPLAYFLQLPIYLRKCRKQFCSKVFVIVSSRRSPHYWADFAYINKRNVT